MINRHYCPDTLSKLTQLLAIQQPSPVQNIDINWPGLANICLHVKRDDLLHPIISGNKWRKLKYSLCHAVQNNVQHIISFGGGFSNHLHALGYCCKHLNIKFTALVRGDYSTNPSPMLIDLIQWQTEIQYVNKNTYQLRDNPDYLNALQQRYSQALIIPEGGSNILAIQGVGEIISELEEEYDFIVAPVASGGTLAGLIQATQHKPTKVKGIAALKGQGYLEQLVNNLLPNDLNINTDAWGICHRYHLGGYAKRNTELMMFCEDFCNQTQIQLEPIYSGKLFFALKELLGKAYFPVGSKVLALHTGGLQGARTG
jgi:1-aminocyclopropane-1-carboxylate deaminase